MTASDSLVGVGQHRSRLGQAMNDVEQAAAAPAGKESWIVDLRHAVVRLETAFDDHIAEVQSPMGLLDGIVDRAPRLQRAVEQTKLDHETIANSIATTLESMEGFEGRSDEIRDTIMGVLLSLAKHRQKGADLIYDAYDVDIGGY